MKRLTRCAALLATLAVLMLLEAAGSAVGADTQVADDGAPDGAVGIIDPGPAPAPGAQADTIPFWTGSFTYRGATYRYDMVGTDPRQGGTTTVATEILPLRLRFADGNVLDATADASDAAASPIFQPGSFAEGATQFGDAMQRGEFWQTMAPDYHVMLATPDILPTVDLSVPPAKGNTFLTSGGRLEADVDATWLLDRIHQTLADLHTSPTSLPIVLSHNTIAQGPHFLGDHGTTDGRQCQASACGSLNGHGRQPVQTYVYATWFPHTFRTNPDAVVLSHEIAEWLNDPFADNTVPSWISPLPAAASGYGCTNLLEVGDPLVQTATKYGNYHLQDEAFLPWFTRQAPSSAINGQYSLFGNLTEPAEGC
jgi:hypothetical protein